MFSSPFLFFMSFILRFEVYATFERGFIKRGRDFYIVILCKIDVEA